MIRIVLPAHLRTLAGIGIGDVLVDVQGDATLRSVLDALEARYPTLRGTIRDHVTLKRRPFIRFFACEEDLSHDPPDALLPKTVSTGDRSRSTSSERLPADDRSSPRRHLRAVPSLLRVQAHEAARPAVRRRRRRAGDGRADARRGSDAHRRRHRSRHRVVPQRSVARVQDGRRHRSGALGAVPSARRGARRNGRRHLADGRDRGG